LYKPRILAKKNVPLRVINDLSFLENPTINQDNEPIIKKQYPRKNNFEATINAPIMEAIVPSQEILFIICKPI
jgi:hypothetical protein